MEKNMLAKNKKSLVGLERSAALLTLNLKSKLFELFFLTIFDSYLGILMDWIKIYFNSVIWTFFATSAKNTIICTKGFEIFCANWRHPSMPERPDWAFKVLLILDNSNHNICSLIKHNGRIFFTGSPILNQCTLNESLWPFKVVIFYSLVVK